MKLKNYNSFVNEAKKTPDCVKEILNMLKIKPKVESNKKDNAWPDQEGAYSQSGMISPKR